MRKGRPIRIAWVDFADHRQYFKTVIECLEKAGCVVGRTEWGTRVKRILEDFQPDLVIIHGISFRDLKEWINWCHSQIQGVKVAVLSATLLSEYRADGFIPARSRQDKFLETVIEILDLKEEDYPLIWREYWEWYRLFYS